MRHRRNKLAATASAPVVNSITFDQVSYAAGSKIMVSVGYSPGTSANTQSFTGTAKDSATSKTGTLSVNFTVINSDTTTVSVSDTGNRVWTPVSNTGGVAIFTSTA